MFDQDFQTRLTAAILSTPGVLRIEPTLQRSMRSLVSGGAGGLTVLERTGPLGPVTQVSVDVATTTVAPAREIARRVRDSIATCLEQGGLVVGGVTVNVLSIESPTNSGAL